MKGMKELTRKQTAAEVRRILNLLPSRELVAHSFANFDLPGLKPGDCRFCAKGAVETFFGDIRLVPDAQGVYNRFTYADYGATYKRLDPDVLHTVEDALFRAVREQKISESDPVGRRKLFQVALSKCDEISAE